MTRTTKRFLSILLTAMMLFTFIPTSALAVGEYLDESEIGYRETVDVRLGVDIIDGVAEKNVSVPGGVLTRGQAAEFVIRLLNGDAPVEITSAEFYSIEEIDQPDTWYIQVDNAVKVAVKEPGHYGARFWYQDSLIEGLWVEVNVSDGSTSSSAETRHVISIKGVDGAAISAAPNYPIPMERFRDALLASVPEGDLLVGVYTDDAYQNPVGEYIYATEDVTLYPKYALASNKVEAVVDDTGTVTAVQVTGPTGTTSSFTYNVDGNGVYQLRNVNVELSDADQATMVAMAQANTGKANNTVYLMNTPAKKTEIVPVVGVGVRYELTPDRFADVSAWAEGYVEYAAQLGIIDGYVQSDGRFDPTGEVRGAEFAKMLLGALGYDADAAQMAYNAFTSDLTINMNASTVRDMAVAGADLVIGTGNGAATIDNENLKKVGEAVKYTTANGEQYVDKKVQFTVAKDKVAITKDGEPATAVKAAFTAYDGIGYVDPTANTVYTTMITDGNRVEPLNALQMKNVDLAGELSNMITSQRGYQANTRIITVTDSMLEELVNMQR